jgi:hypothetical protein
LDPSKSTKSDQKGGGYCANRVFSDASRNPRSNAKLTPNRAVCTLAHVSAMLAHGSRYCANRLSHNGMAICVRKSAMLAQSPLTRAYKGLRDAPGPTGCRGTRLRCPGSSE